MDKLQFLHAYIKESGWSVTSGKAIPYGEQLLIHDGSCEATLNYYPKRGKMVVGGPLSPLRRKLEAWVVEHETTAALPVLQSFLRQQPHIGLDESGKGDWYGPLVVAAVYLDTAQAERLAQAGIRDSKELERASLARLAQMIQQSVKSTQYAVTVLMPEVYNVRYARHNNINLLLAEVYAETACSVWSVTKATRIVCDQFSQRADRLNNAFAIAKLPQPDQQHHAEAISVAVAAASILASDRFVQELTNLGRRAGMTHALPQGASAVSELQQAAKFIMQREGAAGLARYAKVHFRPVRALLGLPDSEA
jgi:ribonuclease HIII